EYGGTMKVGYTTFGWGQPAQMPQLYWGFGFDVIVAGKHIDPARCPESEFIWRSPDGTEILSTKLGIERRQNFYFMATIPIGHGKPGLTPEYKFDWTDAGLLFHRADEVGFYKEYQRVETTMRYRPERIGECIDEVWRSTDMAVMKSDRFLGDGCDFTSAVWFIPQLIEDANKILTDKRLVHSSIPKFLDVLKEKVDRSKLRTIEGELRDGPTSSATCNALSTRLYLKTLNRQGQTGLSRCAEPMAVAAWLAGAEYPKAFIAKAWKFLLLAHSHDSINGVTQDKTSEDVENRLKQVLELNVAVSDGAMTELIRRIDTSQFSPEDVLLVVFNPLPRPRREVVKVWLDTPAEQKVETYHIEDSSGNRMETQRIRSEAINTPVHEMNSRPWPFFLHRHNFYLDTGPVPAGGYKVFRIVKRKERKDWVLAFPELPREYGTMKTSPVSMENEHLAVRFRSDGSFDLTDKKLGRTFERMNYFEDSGDIGNFWMRQPPDHNQTITSIGSPARMWTEDEGPLSTTMVTEVTMMIPARGDYDKSERCGDLRPMTIRSEVTLRKGARRVDIKTSFLNECEDHRLRAMFSTGIDATHSDAQGHFHVDRRPIANETDDEGGYHAQMKTLPHQTFVDVSDGKCGLAFLNRGIIEFEVHDNPERTVGLTLLRCMRNVIFTEMRVLTTFPLQNGAQCLRKHELEYSLYPHAGKWDAGKVFAEAEQFTIPPMLVQCNPHKGHLPIQASRFSLEPDNLVLSALKQAEDRKSVIVRVYNPTSRAITGKVRFSRRIKSARLVNLNEEPIKKIPVSGGHTVSLSVPKHKIVTVELVPA
ncbi:MAG: glycoside hydrolase family 38 C-terminal domain-containing protein, partial [Phycisphaerae bacterium]|nr:glycoside hydrolase family 38 C-terminal domain-containing protein [Phycisphaerae bacterium]